MGLLQLSNPAIEPVTLEDAKNNLRVDSDLTDDDALIRMLISAARRYAENYTGRSLITQGWRLVMDGFPTIQPPPLSPGYYPLRFPGPSPEIQLRRGPVQKVDAIQFLNDQGWQIIDPAKYIFDLSGIVQRVVPAAGCCWPVTIMQPATVKIDFTTGYGDTADKVPEEFKHWILMRVATLYQNREEVAILSRGKVDPLPHVDTLLDYLKVPVI